MAFWPLVCYHNFSLLFQLNRQRSAKHCRGEGCQKDSKQMLQKPSSSFRWSRYLFLCSELFIHQIKQVSETSTRPHESVVQGGFGGVWWVFARPTDQPAFGHEAENHFDCWKDELVYYWWGAEPLGFPLLSAVILKASYYDNLLTS